MFFNRKKLQVKRVGSSLVAAFHKAAPPLIWTFDLERNHSFTLALQGEDGDWELGLTSPKGDFYSVTRFHERDDADEAFTAVQKALMKKRRSTMGLVVKIVGGVVVLALLIAVIAGGGLLMRVGMLAAHPVNPMALQALERARQGLSPTAPASVPAEPPPQGVPVSADDVLKAPR